MEFSPKNLARSVFVCQEQVLKNKDAGEVRVCLRVRKNTRDRLREGETRWVNLVYRTMSHSVCTAFQQKEVLTCANLTVLLSLAS